MTNAPTIEPVLRAMTEVIVREIQPAQIVLFGSHARGEARLDSDVDLLIIQDEPFTPERPRRQLLARLYRCLAGAGIGKDLLLYDRATVEAWRQSLNHVIARALREGRVLYERP